MQEVVGAAPPQAVALTIDDGPHPIWTPQVLEILRRYSVQATFVVIGLQARAYPNLVRQIVSEGHSLCNHTMTHPSRLANLGEPKIRQQIADGQSAIVDAAGVPPALDRSPGGVWSPTVFSVADSFNMISIGWAVDPRDWTRPGKNVITERLLAANPGDILLCHDGGGNRGQTVDALRVVVPTLQARGIQFIALRPRGGPVVPVGPAGPSGPVGPAGASALFGGTPNKPLTS